MIAGFVTRKPERDALVVMATPTVTAKSSKRATSVALEEELRQAEEDFACGDFVELTIDQLDRCTAAGAWPWPDASCE